MKYNFNIQQQAIFICFLAFIGSNNIYGQLANERIISKTNTNQSIVFKVNNPIVLQRPVLAYKENVSQWRFSYDQSVTSIYRNEKLNNPSGAYECEPDEKNCLNLKILNAVHTDAGQYFRQSDSEDGSKSIEVSYFLTAYERPLHIECLSESNKCAFNSTTNKLSVKENEEVDILCSANLWKSGTYDIPADLHFEYNSQHECSTTSKKSFKNSSKKNDFSNLFHLEIMRDCQQKFLRNDKTFTCGIKYTNELSRDTPGDIDLIEVDLDVHYEPYILSSHTENLNRTVSVDKEFILNCPIDGNPIQYSWRTKNSTMETVELKNETGKVLVIKPLPIGEYKFICSGKVEGLFEKVLESDFVVFNVKITDGKTNPNDNNISKEKPQKTNSLLIGLIVGGILLVIIVVFVVVILVSQKRRNSKKSKDGYKEAPQTEH